MTEEITKTITPKCLRRIANEAVEANKIKFLAEQETLLLERCLVCAKEGKFNATFYYDALSQQNGYWSWVKRCTSKGLKYTSITVGRLIRFSPTL